MDVNAADLVIDRFKPILADVFAPDGHTEYWMQGGRGSTKSSFISLAVVLLVASDPRINANIIRRYKNGLRDTVYEQVCWAIGRLGLTPRFSLGRSPMVITYLPTGQEIRFIGLDDPKKVKGGAFATGYGAVQWFEECDEVESWDKIQSVLRTFRRGGDRFWTFYSYNPPKSMWSWVNRQAIEMERNPDAIVDASTYLDVLESGHGDWLGRQFLADADYEREEHPVHYRWEFLGEVTGTGGAVFDNIRRVHLTDADIAGYDNPRLGVDWGWFPDPWRFVQCEWQPGSRRLVIYGERSANRTIPEDTGRAVVDALTYADSPGEEPRYHDETVWCDSADQTSINVYRRKLGIKARPADKGGMRKRSYEWLAGLREIAIDPDRCPLTFEEFSLFEFAKDRDGRWLDDYPDGNDHSIDAVRYAVMRDVRRGM